MNKPTSIIFSCVTKTLPEKHKKKKIHCLEQIEPATKSLKTDTSALENRRGRRRLLLFAFGSFYFPHRPLNTIEEDEHPDGNRESFRLFIHVVRQNLPLGGITCLVGAIAVAVCRDTNKRWMHSPPIHGCSLEDAFCWLRNVFNLHFIPPRCGAGGLRGTVTNRSTDCWLT